MPTLSPNPSPKELEQAYNEGLDAWLFHKEEQAEWEEFCSEQGDPDVALEAIKDTHKDVPRALCYLSREKYDPGAFGQEKQDGPDCTSHGDRSGYDCTRSVEIHIKGEAEEYLLRSVTEFGYGMRGSRGGGSSPGRLAKVKRDIGTLFRKNYVELGLDLSKYRYSIGANAGGRGFSEKVLEEAKKHPVGELIVPKSLDQVYDLLANGYCGHSGQQWACSSSQPADGINRKKGTWNHDMATVGYDRSCEIFKEAVFFVPQSWGEWCPPNKVWVQHQDVLGKYPTGMIVVPEDEYDRYFIRSGSIYFYGKVTGFPAQKLPNYGTQNILA